MQVDYAKLKQRLMQTDIEEIEEKLRSGYYEKDARHVAEEVFQYKRQHPDQVTEEKPVSERRRRIGFLITVGIFASIYFGAKGYLRSSSREDGN
jgi:hypothetical protein